MSHELKKALMENFIFLVTTLRGHSIYSEIAINQLNASVALI